MEVWAVKNDNTKVRVQDDLVLGFRVSLERFNDEFKIGRCLCETAKLTLAKEASIKTNDLVGDGTTTTLVILEGLFNEGLKLIKNGFKISFGNTY